MITDGVARIAFIESFEFAKVIDVLHTQETSSQSSNIIVGTENSATVAMLQLYLPCLLVAVSSFVQARSRLYEPKGFCFGGMPQQLARQLRRLERASATDPSRHWSPEDAAASLPLSKETTPCHSDWSPGGKFQGEPSRRPCITTIGRWRAVRMAAISWRWVAG